LPAVFGKGAALGVTVFFVISGYLITGLLVTERERFGRISLRQFYQRRTLRIFPAFYAFLLAALVMKSFGLVTLLHGDLASAASYTMNYHYHRAWSLGHLWSLAVEEQFYLVWPAVLAILGTERGMYVALGAIVTAPVLRVALLEFVPSSRAGLDQMFPTVADALATGCLLALLRKTLSAWPAYLRYLESPWIAIAPLAIVLCGALDEHARFDGLVGQTVRNVAIALIVDHGVRFPQRPFGRILNLGPVAFVGTLSYSLYLWQQPFINRHAILWMNGFPQNLLLSAGCALASYFFVERPLLAWRNRLRGMQPAPERAPSAAVQGFAPRRSVP
jgi:peptidoglycan/LPS O-acetylase OafA/YrhL